MEYESQLSRWRVTVNRTDVYEIGASVVEAACGAVGAQWRLDHESDPDARHKGIWRITANRLTELRGEFVMRDGTTVDTVSVEVGLELDTSFGGRVARN
jgi:hypothetical protein